MGESTDEEDVGEDSPEARGAKAPLARAFARLRLGKSRKLSTFLAWAVSKLLD